MPLPHALVTISRHPGHQQTCEQAIPHRPMCSNAGLRRSAMLQDAKQAISCRLVAHGRHKAETGDACVPVNIPSPCVPSPVGGAAPQFGLRLVSALAHLGLPITVPIQGFFQNVTALVATDSRLV